MVLENDREKEKDTAGNLHIEDGVLLSCTGR